MPDRKISAMTPLVALLSDDQELRVEEPVIIDNVGHQGLGRAPAERLEATLSIAEPRPHAYSD